MTDENEGRVVLLVEDAETTVRLSLGLKREGTEPIGLEALLEPEQARTVASILNKHAATVELRLKEKSS